MFAGFPFVTARQDSTDERDRATPSMEDSVSIRDHLFRLGLDIFGNSGRRARGAAVPAGWNAILRRWNRALCLDARERYALSHRSRVGISFIAGGADLRDGLRAALLG